MKKKMLLLFCTSAFTLFLTSCRESQEAAEETGEAVEEGVEEVGENTGIEGTDDM